jgi:hypothetical protein
MEGGGKDVKRNGCKEDEGGIENCCGAGVENSRLMVA